MLRTGVAAAKGVADAATFGQLEEGVDLGNRGVAKLLGEPAPASVEET
ncbi:MAG: hypothetical protein ACRENP_10565 [Longimicrobiales bacterium]